jgi:hypothetical protein
LDQIDVAFEAVAAVGRGISLAVVDAFRRVGKETVA